MNNRIGGRPTLTPTLSRPGGRGSVPSPRLRGEGEGEGKSLASTFTILIRSTSQAELSYDIWRPVDEKATQCVAFFPGWVP